MPPTTAPAPVVGATGGPRQVANYRSSACSGSNRRTPPCRQLPLQRLQWEQQEDPATPPTTAPAPVVGATGGPIYQMCYIPDEQTKCYTLGESLLINCVVFLINRQSAI